MLKLRYGKEINNHQRNNGQRKKYGLPSFNETASTQRFSGWRLVLDDGTLQGFYGNENGGFGQYNLSPE